jgi:hypothetical protein
MLALSQPHTGKAQRKSCYSRGDTLRRFTCDTIESAIKVVALIISASAHFVILVVANSLLEMEMEQA